MKKSLKKIILSLVMVSLLVACSSKKPQEAKPLSVDDLISSIEKSEDDAGLDKSDDEGDLSKAEDNNLARDLKEDLEEPSKKSNNKDSKVKESDIRKVKIKAFGDIMAHKAQLDYALNKGGDFYDFSDQFTYIRDFISDSDIAIGNYESTTNPNLAYAGFPRFNSPKSYLDEIKRSGFDIVSTANNHSMDTGLEGVFTTMENAREASLLYVGSFKDKDDKILYKEVNGVNFAFLSYTYGCNGEENLVVPREEIENLGYLTNPDIIKSDIKKARENGADFIVVYPHWGIEYNSYPDQSQIELGRNMLEWGADLVIGNHPHVVQPVEKYKTEDGRVGLIAYALGNFISYQNLENNNDIRVEQSLALEIDLAYDKVDGKKSIEDVKFHPLWVGSYHNDLGVDIKTHLAEDFLEGGKYYDYVNEYQRERIKKAHDMTLETANTEVD